MATNTTTKKAPTRTSKKTAESKIEETTIESVDTVVDEETVIEEKVVNNEPLVDTDEIAVVSVIPNVSYKDAKNNDFYSWSETDHTEYMTVAVIKDMWRNSKSYFKNMWLKPEDDRVIAMLGLKKTYDAYDLLMNPESYSKDNLKTIESKISILPTGLKETLIRKIKDMIVNGEISNAHVIKSMEKYLSVDLFYLLD